MAKGAVLDEAFIAAAGLSEQLLTLTRPIENKHHAVLQEPMFHIYTEEVEETIFLERKYVFDNQVSIRAQYGKGDKVLVWMQRIARKSPQDGAAVNVLMAREFFVMGDWREFQRFRMFVKSQRILDAQSRQWISENHPRFKELAQTAEGIGRILDSLSAVAEWPDMEGQDQEQARSTLEIIAKAYSSSLAPVRASPLLPSILLRRAPDARFNIFRLFALVEDPEGGARSLVRFLGEMGKATTDPKVVQMTTSMKTSLDIARAFTVLQGFLLSRSMTNPGNLPPTPAPAAAPVAPPPTPPPSA
ncbi:MAG: hypothetical protein AAB263_10435 [Planctomycetota bacterium]